MNSPIDDEISKTEHMKWCRDLDADLNLAEMKYHEHHRNYFGFKKAERSWLQNIYFGRRHLEVAKKLKRFKEKML